MDETAEIEAERRAWAEMRFPFSTQLPNHGNYKGNVWKDYDASNPIEWCQPSKELIAAFDNHRQRSHRSFLPDQPNEKLNY